jgi:hypothetical protein
VLVQQIKVLQVVMDITLLAEIVQVVVVEVRLLWVQNQLHLLVVMVVMVLLHLLLVHQ